MKRLILILTLLGCNASTVAWVDRPTASTTCLDATSSYFDQDPSGDLYLVCYYHCAFPPTELNGTPTHFGTNDLGQVWIWIRYDDGHQIAEYAPGCADE